MTAPRRWRRCITQAGRTIAEAEATAIVWGMPGELVRRGGAGQVLPLTRIADALLGMITHAAH